MDCAPARCGMDPDQGEPSGLLGLRTAGEYETTRHECRLSGKRSDADALHAQALFGPAIDEIRLAERFLDGFDRRARAAFGHDRNRWIVNREVAFQITAIPGVDGSLHGSANLRLVLRGQRGHWIVAGHGAGAKKAVSDYQRGRQDALCAHTSDFPNRSIPWFIPGASSVLRSSGSGLPIQCARLV